MNAKTVCFVCFALFAIQNSCNAGAIIYGDLQQIGQDQFSQNTVYESFEKPVERSVDYPFLVGSQTSFTFPQSGITVTAPAPSVAICSGENDGELGVYGQITPSCVPDGDHYLINCSGINYTYELTFPYGTVNKFGGYWIMGGENPGNDYVIVYAYGANNYIGPNGTTNWIGTAYIPACMATDWKTNLFSFASTGGYIQKLDVQVYPITGAGYAGVDNLMFDYVRNPGDANLDGSVDGADLGAVLANYNKTGMNWTNGDFNNDGSVDGADLGAVLANYNKNFSSLSANVPEPPTWLLEVIAILALLFIAKGSPFHRNQ